MARFSNGNECPIGEDWQSHRDKVSQVADSVSDMHEDMKEIRVHAQHLDQLNVIAGSITEMKDKLLGIATGKDQMPMQMGMKVVNVLLGVIIALVLVIGSMLIGEKFGIIKDLIR